MVELAVLLPLGVLLLTAGEWMTELLAVRLKAREAARFAAWERTFLRAGEATEARVIERYVDLDSSAELERPRPFFTHAGRPAVFFDEVPLSWDAPELPLHPDAAGRAASIAARARIAPLALAGSWGLPAASAHRATVSVEIAVPRWGMEILGPARSPQLPEHLAVRASVALVAGSWASPDGADSRVEGGRTGIRSDGERSALWEQVNRMKLFGDPALLAPERRVAESLELSAAPEVDGTFVVDHALRPGRSSGCEGAPGFPDVGLSTLRDFGDTVDPGAPRCFGTQPFRDTQEYEASLQLHAARARGPWFMGCPNAQADDPSRSADGDLTDANTLKRSCGGGR